nr:indole-3-glycerol phosphate synthase TrpC [Parafrankia elaeagni]
MTTPVGSRGRLLAEILASQRAELPRRMAQVGIASLRRRVEDRAMRLSGAQIITSLRGPEGVRVIAEVKRNSPARGALAPIADPAALAAAYAAGGAAAISVLTEPRFFGGTLDDLAAVRERVGVPVLRKDFVVHPYQVVEAAAYGADLVLLIVAALEPRELAGLLDEAAGCGLAALVEVHSEAELAVAVDAGAQIVGVNARDLTTLAVDRDILSRLAHAIPGDVVCVAESGVRGPDDVRAYAAAGADAVLVGSSLVVHEQPADAVAALVEAGRRAVPC